MTLRPSSRLGPYEIVAPLGAGGMGEVYRARDTRLGRDVAIKVLPEALAQDADAQARFRREVLAVAALSHPNILAIHDVGTDQGVIYAVTELLDGETLRDRLRSSPFPWRKAASVALQLAEGLAAAHAKSIVHRDLKPENIVLTSSGQAKILDFGLARIARTAEANADTRLRTITRPGTVMGTVGYMSPEQIRGDEVDQATDIFAFGCVLYEMLSGRAPFTRSTPAETMAAALRDEPAPLGDRVGDVPASLEAIVAHCLEKRPADRFQSARDMAFALRAVAASSGPAGPVTAGGAVTRAVRLPGWLLAAAVAVTLVAGAVVGWWWARSTVSAPGFTEPVRLSIELSAASPLAPKPSPRAGSSIAISPDGRVVAYIVGRDGPSRLVVRGLDRFDETMLTGTDDAGAPFFSPDGRWIAFFTETALKKVPVTGGTPTTLCVTPPVTRGAVWADDNTIYFAPNFSGGLQAVAASGGNPKDITTVDLKAGESNHLLPEALPGGKALLYTVWKGGDFGAASIWSLSLRTGERKLVLEPGAAPRFVPPGFLIFARAGALFAVRFDPERLVVSGDAVPVVDGVWTDRAAGTTHYAVSRNGTVLYVPGGDTVALRRLVWVDRQGHAEALPAQANLYGAFGLSPDGKRLAIERLNDIWVYDLAAGTFSRVSFRGVNQTPVWAPDSRHLAFSSSEGFADPRLYWTDVDAAGRPEPMSREGRVQFPGSWTPDGGTLGYTEIAGSPAEAITGWDVWLIRPGATPTRTMLIGTQFNEEQPIFSPAGRGALAYVSDETGQRQVYLRPYPGAGDRRRVSVDGGTEPAWSRSGDELFYRNGRQYFSVPVAGGDAGRAGQPVLMFQGDFVVTSAIPGAPSYAVAPDGRRFIMLSGAAETPRLTRIDVVLNWAQELERRLRSAGSR